MEGGYGMAQWLAYSSSPKCLSLSPSSKGTKLLWHNGRRI